MRATIGSAPALGNRRAMLTGVVGIALAATTMFPWTTSSDNGVDYTRSVWNLEEHSTSGATAGLAIWTAALAIVALAISMRRAPSTGGVAVGAHSADAPIPGLAEAKAVSTKDLAISAAVVAGFAGLVVLWVASTVPNVSRATRVPTVSFVLCAAALAASWSVALRQIDDATQRATLEDQIANATIVDLPPSIGNAPRYPMPYIADASIANRPAAKTGLVRLLFAASIVTSLLTALPWVQRRSDEVYGRPIWDLPDSDRFYLDQGPHDGWLVGPLALGAAIMLLWLAMRWHRHLPINALAFVAGSLCVAVSVTSTQLGSDLANSTTATPFFLTMVGAASAIACVAVVVTDRLLRRST
jgi:hypothetical protein